jgi:hypothetical protein
MVECVLEIFIYGSKEGNTANMKKYKDFILNRKETEKVYDSKYYARSVYFIKSHKDNNDDIQ